MALDVESVAKAEELRAQRHALRRQFKHTNASARRVSSIDFFEQRRVFYQQTLYGPPEL